MTHHSKMLVAVLLLWFHGFMLGTAIGVMLQRYFARLMNKWLRLWGLEGGDPHA